MFIININKERLIHINKCIDLWFAEDCGASQYDRSTSVKWQGNYIGTFIGPNVFYILSLEKLLPFHHVYVFFSVNVRIFLFEFHFFIFHRTIVYH